MIVNHKIIDLKVTYFQPNDPLKLNEKIYILKILIKSKYKINGNVKTDIYILSFEKTCI